GEHTGLVAAERARPAAPAEGPDAQAVVEAGGNQAAAVGAEGDRVDGGGVAVEDAHRLAVGGRGERHGGPAGERGEASHHRVPPGQRRAGRRKRSRPGAGVLTGGTTRSSRRRGATSP